MKQLLSILFCTFWIGLIISTGCRQEVFTTNPDHSIELSTDTLWFDTVFTKVNSRTPKSVNKQVLIYNPYDESIKTSIRLEGGEQSHFRLNVDGEPGYVFNDIEIFPNDSIFMFVEVHPDPNNNSPDFNPLIIRDSILFNTNGNERKLNLIGWGQDAHYIFRDSIETDTTWADPNLPIVVYGYFYVKPGAKLTIEKDMQIHFAPYSWLFVEGELEIRGTAEEPVIMQGDRLQPSWEETAGQWGGIWFNWPTHSNFIEHALIKNGTVGIYCDTLSGDPNQPNVRISKTHIRNMSFDGVAGRYSTIEMTNSISANCGRYTFLGSFGGDYTLYNNTFYCDSRDFSRQGPTFGYTNQNRDAFGRVLGTYPIRFRFINNIVEGTNREGEIGNDLDANKVDAGSVVDYNMLQTQNAFYFGSGSNNLDTDSLKFIDVASYNFQLDTLSPAKDKGFELAIPDDHFNRPRIDKPDLGAFESQF